MKNAISSSTTVDFTAIGKKRFRDRLRSALGQIEGTIPESDQFWQAFVASNAPSSGETQTLVLADLWRLVHEFQRHDVHGWTASVRRSQPFFVAFVRTERDRACTALVDDLLRATDMRVNVCNEASDWGAVFECLRAGVSSVRRDGLIDVRYVATTDALWAQFGDGLAGTLGWDDMGLAQVRERLVPESATVGPTRSAIELSTRDGGLFEIDSASVRALIDKSFAAELRRSEAEYHETLGARLRRAREEAGLTQPALGERAGLDQAVISRLERGKVRPRIDTLRRLAEGLGLSVSELLSA
jgi:DNA-binding XRE family transcriptional regulator